MIKLFSVLTVVFLCISSVCKAQSQDDKILLTIDGETYDAGTFKKVYLKNLDIVQDASQKDLDNYLQLYIDYRLKLIQAYEMGLQNGIAYQEELASYRKSLSESYLTDNEVTDELIKEAYNRMVEEVNASHILIKLSRSASPADSLIAYKQIQALRGCVVSLEDFESVARSNSEGPSASSGGELGWFGPFKMVDEFENAAYNTEVGKISEIFRTDYGYHILKLNDRRPAPGDVTVAHIMTYDKGQDSTVNAEQRIREIYGQLKSGKDFAAMARSFSEDVNTANNGGKLTRFGTGALNTPAFEKAAFELKEIGDYTAPVMSKYGWHIIQLLEKYPVPSFADTEANLREQIKNSPRSRKITEAFTNKLMDKYEVQPSTIDSYSTRFPQVTDSIMKGSWKNETQKIDVRPLFWLRDKEFTTGQFYDFIVKKQKKDYRQFGSREEKLAAYYKDFLNETLIDYYDENLERDNFDFAFIYREYKEGLLLFDLMEKKVWEEAKKDTVGQLNYYNAHKEEYKWKRRLDINLTQNTSEDTAVKVKALLEQGKSIEEIKGQLNGDGNTQVMVSTGIVEETFPRLPKGFAVKKGVSPVFEKEENGFYKVIQVNEILESAVKSFDEARGSVINDYQQQLETQWLESLRNDRNIEVNQKVFEQVKKELEKTRA